MDASAKRMLKIVLGIIIGIVVLFALLAIIGVVSFFNGPDDADALKLIVPERVYPS